MQSIIVHAHFYQPPREDPWLEVVDREHSAAPYHDWNARIEQDCYRAVVAARIPAPDGRICRVANLLESVSFNVGATLLAWLERHAPSTYTAILQADATSRQRLGHGNAMAMPYHHVILPLASRRDKVTEVRWGIRDFRRRFGREPEGLWLPETAVDEETLDVLAAERIRFTVLAPHQLASVPLHGLPAMVRTSGGRRIAVFPYDGPLSHDVAFGPLIRDADAWTRRMVLPPDDVRGPKLVAVATDGETYGHHHRFGEMALARMLEKVAAAGVTIGNFASFLARHPPLDTVPIVAPSSWSCSHGVERWRADCGCRIEPGTSQAWRAPLRESLDWLKAQLDERFEREGRRWFRDPWAARDGHDPDGSTNGPVEGRELLEQQRTALRMFMSCGWFFDDIAGIEALLCLRYAACAIDLAGPEGNVLREGLTERLAAARSNEPDAGTGADLFRAKVLPVHGGPERAAAGLAALAAVDPDGASPAALGTYDLVDDSSARVAVRHRRTRKTSEFSVAVHQDGVARLVVELTEPAGRTARLGVGELPEPARELLRERAQRRLLGAAFDEEERAVLARGTRTFAQVLEQAMCRHLGDRAESVDLEALRAALDLLALDARPVPFDVQTRFYRVYTQAPPQHRARLQDLASSFGFSPSCLVDPADQRPATHGDDG
ncbi:MAG TPA: DUF3536 domain-containing protein [Gemmatimonadales bacterium]